MGQEQHPRDEGMMKLSSPIPFSSAYSAAEFSCGELSLDSWLQKRAAKNELSGASRTYVVTNQSVGIVAFYSLAVGSVAQVVTPGNIKRNMPDPVPVVILARLGVDISLQGQGIGKALVRDAVLRAHKAARLVGIRALLVHALHEKAATFYRECGFRSSPIDNLTLMLRIDQLPIP